MEETVMAILLELQNSDAETVAVKLATFLAERHIGANDLRWWFRNTDCNGMRRDGPHHSCR